MGGYTDLGYGTYIKDLECKRSDENTLCVAVGRGPPDYFSFLAVSDGLQSWKKMKIHNDEYDTLNKVSCTGAGFNSICVAISYKIAFVSTDGGSTWNKEDFSYLGDISLSDVNCVSNANSVNSVCVISGHKYLSAPQKDIPILIVSRDGAKTWQLIDQGIPLYGSLESTQCINTDKEILCTAVGNFENPQEMGLITLSTDGGKIWKTQIPANLQVNSRFEIIGSAKTDKILGNRNAIKI